MKPKKQDTDFWSKKLDRRPPLKMLAGAGSVMAFKGPRGPAEARGIAPLAMKSFSGNAEPIKQGIVTVERALPYVMSLPVASLVSGIDSQQVLQQHLGIVRRLTPMTAAETQQLRIRMASYAMDGRFERFKSSRDYGVRIGREQPGCHEVEKGATDLRASFF